MTPFLQHDEGLHVIDYGADKSVTRYVLDRPLHVCIVYLNHSSAIVR